MASTTTRLADVFIPQVYASLKPEDSPELTAILNSGIIAESPQLTAAARTASGIVTLYGWKDLDADEEPNASNTDPDEIGKVGNVHNASMIARVQHLNKGYGVMDLVNELATDKPMQHIRNRFGTYWARRMQRILLSTARGVCAGNLANNKGDMVIDAGDDIDARDIQDAVYTLGDHSTQITAIGMHSAVMHRFTQLDLIQYYKDSNGKVLFATFMDKLVLMDDGLQTADKRYLTVLYGNGAFGLGYGTPEVPVELERKASSGNGGGGSILWERKTLILHPHGFDYKGNSDAEKTPSTKDLEGAKIWARNYDRKNVPLAFIVSGANLGGLSKRALADLERQAHARGEAPGTTK